MLNTRLTIGTKSSRDIHPVCPMSWTLLTEVPTNGQTKIASTIRAEIPLSIEPTLRAGSRGRSGCGSLQGRFGPRRR
jgi:hypothetical protein